MNQFGQQAVVRSRDAAELMKDLQQWKQVLKTSLLDWKQEKDSAERHIRSGRWKLDSKTANSLSRQIKK